MTQLELINTYGKLIPAVQNIEANTDSGKFWYDVACAVFNNYLGNGGANLDYTDKEYGYLSDSIDACEVLFLGNEPDGDRQNELAETGEPMTEQEVIDDLYLRLSNILIDLGYEVREQPTISDNELSEILDLFGRFNAELQNYSHVKHLLPESLTKELDKAEAEFSAEERKRQDQL